MSSWSPPSIPRTWIVGVGLLYVLIVGYSVVVAQEILFGVWIGLLFGSLFLLWRFVAAVEGIADALQRISRQREDN